MLAYSEMLCFSLSTKCIYLSPYYEKTVISKEYTGSLDFHIVGVDCIDFVTEYVGNLHIFEYSTLNILNNRLSSALNLCIFLLIWYSF